MTVKLERNADVPAPARWYWVLINGQLTGKVVKDGRGWRAWLSGRDAEYGHSILFGTVVARPAAANRILGSYQTRSAAVSAIEDEWREQAKR